MRIGVLQLSETSTQGREKALNNVPRHRSGLFERRAPARRRKVLKQELCRFTGPEKRLAYSIRLRGEGGGRARVSGESCYELQQITYDVEYGLGRSAARDE